jgi:exodeoxyribonuclease VII small subunit
MATDGGKRAERPADVGDGKQPAKGAKAGTDPADKAKARQPASAARPGDTGGDDGARLPYEQARDQLTELVKRLEAGGLTLEQSLELWERGERLAAICEEWLEGARARLAAAMSERTDHEAAPGTPF